MKASLLGRGQVSIRGLFKDYQSKVRQHHLDNPNRKTRQSGMCYESYRKLVWMARISGLIQISGKGDEIPGLSMMEMDASGELQIVPAAPVFMSLTFEGGTEILAWENIPRFYSSRVLIQRGLTPPVPSLELPGIFNLDIVPSLRTHLRELQRLATAWGWPENPWPELAGEIESIAGQTMGWSLELGDRFLRFSLVLSPETAQLIRLQDQADVMGAVSRLLRLNDIEQALSQLGLLSVPRA